MTYISIVEPRGRYKNCYASYSLELVFGNNVYTCKRSHILITMRLKGGQVDLIDKPIDGLTREANNPIYLIENATSGNFPYKISTMGCSTALQK